MKTKVIFIIAITVFLLAGCATADQTVQKAIGGVTGVKMQPASAAADPANDVADPPSQDEVVSQPAYNYAGLPDCIPSGATPENDPSSKPGYNIWFFQVSGDLWRYKVKGSGCNLVFEGRVIAGERIHRVIVLRSQQGENTQFIKDGVFEYSEGSIWALSRAANIDDLNGFEPAAMKLVNDKRAVQEAAGYDWPIVASLVDGSDITFAPGEKWEGLEESNHCDFSVPQKIAIHGEKIAGNRFSAAIGATGCKTVAWIDGAKIPEIWTGQFDAGQKVQYTKIEAWLMPSSWADAQIQDWISH